MRRAATPIDHILSKLTNVQRKGRGHTATCPLHPSKPAVLRITREFGQVLLECRARCPDHGIEKRLAALPLDVRKSSAFPSRLFDSRGSAAV